MIYLCRPSYQNVNSLRIDTSSSQKYLDLHLDSSGGGQSERPGWDLLSYLIQKRFSCQCTEHRQENKPALGVWQCHWLSVEIYGFEKLGSHHQLLIWDRKDSGRYHHKIPVSNCFFFFEFLLDAKLSHDRKSVWDGSREERGECWWCPEWSLWLDMIKAAVINSPHGHRLSALADLIRKFVALFWSIEDSFRGVYMP